jgi:putative transposase
VRPSSASTKGTRHAAANDVLDRQLVATGPNQKWIVDFTYIWTGEGWLCVAAVIDPFTRRVIGKPAAAQPSPPQHQWT